MSKSLKKNTLFTLVANVSLALSNWLVLVIIAKHYSSEVLGVFVLALSLCSPAFLFASFKMRTLLVVDTHWRYSLEEYAFSRLFANFCVTVALLSGVILGLINLPLNILVLVIAYKWFDSWSEYCQSYMRRLNKFGFSSCSMTLRSFFTFIAVLLFSINDGTLLGLLSIWCLVSFIFCIADSISMAKLLKKTDKRSYELNTLVRLKTIYSAFSLYKEYSTVAVALVISSLFVYLPNILLSHILNVEAAGQFAAISYFLVAGGILINSISQASTPKLASLLKSNDYPYFASIVIKMCITGLAIGVLGISFAYFFGEFFLTVFYTEDIAQYHEVLNWVMAAAAVRYVYIFLGTSLAAVQQFHIQTKIYAFGLTVMFIAGTILISKDGMIGAAQAMFLATLSEFVCFALLSKKHWRSAFKSNEGIA